MSEKPGSNSDQGIVTMPNDEGVRTALQEIYQGVLSTTQAYLPQLLGGLLLLLGGWLLARLLRSLVVRLADGLGRWLPRLLPGRLRHSGSPGRLPAVLGGIVFWTILLTFFAAAAQLWGLTLFAVWLDRILIHLPLVVAGLLIMLLGFVLGQFTRDLVRGMAADLEYRDLLAGAAQLMVWSVATVIALELIGLDITFLVVLAAIIVGAIAGGVALAFGLGARGLVQDLLSMREVRARYRAGDAVRIGEWQGRIVELDTRSVILETDDGSVALPGRLFSSQPCTLLIKDSADV